MLCGSAAAKGCGWFHRAAQLSLLRRTVNEGVRFWWYARPMGSLQTLGKLDAHWHEALTSLPGTCLLFVYALMFALVEIEIEGKAGWAMNLPTWFRRRPWYARVYAFMLSGKPLTGYHAVMFVVPFVSFHIGLAFGQPWSWGLEARLVATYLVWNVTWDLLWFLYNPAFGWERFRKGQIWWHDGKWVGRLPIDYVNALWVSFTISLVPWVVRGESRYLWQHAAYVAFMVLLVLLAVLFAPLYQSWYRYMRRPGSDERPDLSGRQAEPRS